MIRNSLTVLLSLFVAQFAIAIPVQSAPYPYVASWRQKYSMSQCVNDAYTIARKHPFTDDQQLTNESAGKLKTLHGSHKAGEHSIAILCSRDDGLAAFSVSRYHNDETHNMYSDTHKSFNQI